MRWGYQKVSENGIVRNSEGAASAALSISLTIFPRPDRIGCGDFFQLAGAVALFARVGQPPSQILREHPVSGTKKTGHWTPWTKEGVRELRAHSKARTPLLEIAKKMKRTERALRRKAGILGIGLGHRR